MIKAAASKTAITTRTLPSAIVCDLDGTLVDVRTIRHFVEDPHDRNFEAFHAASIDCPANANVSRLLSDAHARGALIVLVTAREERWSFLTTMWLRDHQIDFDELLMRRARDYRPDHIVKREFAKSLASKYSVEVAIDDRDDILAVWQDAGFATLKVHQDGSLGQRQPPSSASSAPPA